MMTIWLNQQINIISRGQQQFCWIYNVFLCVSKQCAICWYINESCSKCSNLYVDSISITFFLWVNAICCYCNFVQCCLHYVIIVSKHLSVKQIDCVFFFTRSETALIDFSPPAFSFDCQSCATWFRVIYTVRIDKGSFNLLFKTSSTVNPWFYCWEEAGKWRGIDKFCFAVMKKKHDKYFD